MVTQIKKYVPSFLSYGFTRFVSMKFSREFESFKNNLSDTMMCELKCRGGGEGGILGI
jgi:hypothetical protein